MWKSDDPAYPRVDVYGSLAELERDFGVRRRPTCTGRTIDELTRPNPDDPTGQVDDAPGAGGAGLLVRVGSMPFAQVHYPFENRDWFEHHYPGDFIVEYIGQTRGWFYTMHVLATALFDRPAFRNCVSHGILLGDDGRKMSKSLRNYPDVYEMFDTLRLGRDALDADVLAGAARRRHAGHRGGDPRRGAPGAASTVERLVLLLALRQRGGLRRRGPRTDSTHLLDRYVLAKTGELVADRARAQMDAYDISGACAVGAVLPGRADQLVRAPLPGPVLGRRRATRSTRCTRCWRRCAGWSRRWRR